MKTYRIFLLTSIGALFLGLAFFLSIWWIAYGWEEATDSFDSMIIPVAITAVVLSFFYRRRLKYLDSEERIPPVFQDTSYREFDIEAGRFDFDQFLQLAAENHVITGKGENTLKLRRKFTVLSWGAGAFLQYDKDNSKIDIHYFPISGYTSHGSRAVRKMDKSVEELIRRSLKS